MKFPFMIPNNNETPNVMRFGNIFVHNMVPQNWELSSSLGWTWIWYEEITYAFYDDERVLKHKDHFLKGFFLGWTPRKEIIRWNQVSRALMWEQWNDYDIWILLQDTIPHSSNIVTTWVITICSPLMHHWLANIWWCDQYWRSPRFDA